MDRPARSEPVHVAQRSRRDDGATPTLTAHRSALCSRRSAHVPVQEQRRESSTKHASPLLHRAV
jgi:hypothetical protein